MMIIQQADNSENENSTAEGFSNFINSINFTTSAVVS